MGAVSAPFLPRSVPTFTSCPTPLRATRRHAIRCNRFGGCGSLGNRKRLLELNVGSAVHVSHFRPDQIRAVGVVRFDTDTERALANLNDALSCGQLVLPRRNVLLRAVLRTVRLEHGEIDPDIALA